MAYTYEQIVASEYEGLRNEEAAAMAALEDARLREDPDGVAAATTRLYSVDNQVAALNRRVSHIQRSQQAQPAPNPYGLSKDEQDIARLHPDPGMSVDAKERLYAQNKQRYQQLRQSGYRDETDLQGRR